MKQINAKEAAELLNQPEKTVLIDFFATWCGPCKMLAPVLEAVAPHYPDVEFVKIDVDGEPALAGQFGVQVIPTLVVVRGGKILASSTGYRDEAGLAAFLDGAL